MKKANEIYQVSNFGYSTEADFGNIYNQYKNK